MNVILPVVFWIIVGVSFILTLTGIGFKGMGFRSSKLMFIGFLSLVVCSVTANIYLVNL